MVNPYRFSTKEYSSKSGLIYFGARYYDPKVGRFISKDFLPGNIYSPSSLHRYVYVENNPINWVDPFGLCKGERNFWGEYYDYMNWVWDFYTPGKVPGGLSKNAYGYAQEGWQAHVGWHKELRRSVSEGGSYGQGGPYVALAGVETVGLGGLLTTGGFTAIAEGGAAVTIAGGGWVVIGVEVIWIGVDIIGGYRDSIQKNQEQNGYNK